jgi:hypothetical protein
MRKILEVLRLRFESNLSFDRIAAATRISKGAVTKYLGRAKAAGISWPLPAAIDEAALEALLFARAAPAVEPRAAPDLAHVHQELKRKGVTLMLLWQEYAAAHAGQAYGYSQFCLLYHRFAQSLKRSMRQIHRAAAVRRTQRLSRRRQLPQTPRRHRQGRSCPDRRLRHCADGRAGAHRPARTPRRPRRHSFDAHYQPASLGGKLRAEPPGVLNWALTGCREWQTSRLVPPKAVMDPVAEYKEDMDILGQWVAERCDVGAELEVQNREAYIDYRLWAEVAGLKQWSEGLWLHPGAAQQREACATDCACGGDSGDFRQG